MELCVTTMFGLVQAIQGLEGVSTPVIEQTMDGYDTWTSVRTVTS